MTTLLLDIGNTRLKWGALQDDQIEQTASVALRDLPGALSDEFPQPVGAAIASNVAGADNARRVAQAVAAQCNVEVTFVTPSAQACGVRNAYDDPASLGVDRWVALIGARACCTGACLVVDAGTAITVDAMDASGQHLGGQILPGLALMSASLNDRTSDLPRIDAAALSQTAASQVFGRSTTSAIAAGIVGAVTAAIERGVDSLGGDATLLLTGGDAELVQQHLARPVERRKDLVLEGLARLSQDS